MIRIQSAAKDDLDHWAAIRIKLWPGHDAAGHQKEICQDFSHPERECFLAMDGDRVIGFAELSLRSVVDGCTGSPVAYLEGLYVEPEYQEQGVGRLLVESGEDWGMKNGCTEMGSDAEIGNRISILVHQKLGFEEVDRVVQFRKALSKTE